MKFLKNNENLLVAMLIYSNYYTSWDLNPNLRRPVSRKNFLRPRETKKQN